MKNVKNKNEHKNFVTEGEQTTHIIEKTIGKGTFGKVKIGYHIPTNEKVAIKILEKSKILEPEDLERVNREIKYLKKLNNSHVIKIYEILESNENYFIIMEYAKGGELFNYIVSKKRLDDKEASFFFTQIIIGLEYVHKNNIVHRDLKPENLLLDENKTLKIIDFGLSNHYDDGQLLSTPCGSPCYAAPEMILGKKYSGLQVDIWSTGIILFAMVCGFLPFEDKNNEKLYKKIVECNLEFPPYLTEKCKDIIKRLLTVNPKKRITLEEIKLHSFYQQGEFQIIKEKKVYDKQKLFDKILTKMESLGFNKEIVIKNLEMNKHNNVTTTYNLLSKKYETTYMIKKSKSEDIEKVIKTHPNELTSNRNQSAITETNPNININIKYLKNFGNININISDPKGINEKSIRLRDVSNIPNKNSKLYFQVKIREIQDEIASKYIDSKPTYIGENENNDAQKNTSFETYPIHTVQNDVKSPIDFLDVKFKCKNNKKKTNITSTSYDFNNSIENVQKNKLEDFFNKSSNNKILFKLNNSNEGNLIYKRIDKKNKYSSSQEKTIKKSDCDFSMSKNSNLRKNDMNVINEDIEIKKKLNKHHTKVLESNSNKTNNELTKEFSNKNTNLSNFNIFKRNIKNLSQDVKKASEKDNLAKTIILNNLSNDIKNSIKGNNNEFAHTTFKSNLINEDKYKNPLKAYNKNVPSSTKNNFQINFLIKNQIKSHLINYSNNLSPDNNLSKYKPDTIIIDHQEVKPNNARSVTPKINNNFKKSDNLKSFSNNNQIYNNQVLFTEVGKNNTISKHKINSKSTSKDQGIIKLERLNEKMFPLKKIVNNKNLDVSSYLDKIKKADFSCCTISNMSVAQEKLQKFCISKNMLMKEIGKNKYECKKDNNTIGIEFANIGQKGKFMKIFHVDGDEAFSKMIIKNIIINIGI